LSEALDLPSRSSLPWTPEDIDTLRRMISCGHRGRGEIANKLGRSREAVSTKACELGLVRRSVGKAARKTDGPTDGRDITAFRKACEEANDRYVQAVIAAGGGSWSGHVTPNSSGSDR
jgi:hypothetical protein